MLSERAKAQLGLAAATLVLIACLATLVSGTLHRGDMRAALPGSVAPDFALRDADNKPVELSDLRGNVVIVYFRGNSESAPTTAPANLTSTDGSVASAPAAGEQDVKTVSNQVVASASSDKSDLNQLSLMSHQLSNPHVRVLDLETPPDSDDATTASAVSAPSDGSVKMLIDSTGDVARKYKIDASDAQPTIFVIDPSGVIRYRGNSLASASMTPGQSLSPATQPSSCPQVVQTLLSSEALDLAIPVAIPVASHF